MRELPEPAQHRTRMLRTRARESSRAGAAADGAATAAAPATGQPAAWQAVRRSLAPQALVPVQPFSRFSTPNWNHPCTERHHQAGMHAASLPCATALPELRHSPNSSFSSPVPTHSTADRSSSGPVCATHALRASIRLQHHLQNRAASSHRIDWPAVRPPTVTFMRRPRNPALTTPKHAC